MKMDVVENKIEEEKKPDTLADKKDQVDAAVKKVEDKVADLKAKMAKDSNDADFKKFLNEKGIDDSKINEITDRIAQIKAGAETPEKKKDHSDMLAKIQMIVQ